MLDLPRAGAGRGARGATAPARRRQAAGRAAVASAEAPAAADGYYTVKQGDTLYSIALDHGADYREVAQWNALDDPTKLRIGQVLRVKPPDAQRRRAPRGGGRRGEGAGKVEARGSSSRRARRQGQAGRCGAPRRPRSEVEAAVDFIWPAKGKVLAGFAEPRSKGIDIDGKIGDPVVAAAAGRVTYIGTGIPGLGKLVVIKHDNGFITVYAHNKDILVKEQQTRGARPEDRRARQHRRRPAEAALPDPQRVGGGRPDALLARVLILL